LAFYFHILTTIHGQNHIKFVNVYLNTRKPESLPLKLLTEFLNLIVPAAKAV